MEHQAYGPPHLHQHVVNDLCPYTLREKIYGHCHRFDRRTNRSTPEQREYYSQMYEEGCSRDIIEKEAICTCTQRGPVFDPVGIDVRHIDQEPEDFERLSRYLLKEAPEFLLIDKDGLK